MNIEEAQEEIARLKAANDSLAKAQVWYSESLEALSSTRYHLSKLLECCDMAIIAQESLTKLGKGGRVDVLNTFIHRSTYDEAKAAQAEAEEHFTNARIK